MIWAARNSLACPHGTCILVSDYEENPEQDRYDDEDIDDAQYDDLAIDDRRAIDAYMRKRDREQRKREGLPNPFGMSSD